VDVARDVHPGHQGQAGGVGEGDLHWDHLGDLLEVPGAVGLGEQGEFGGGRALDLGDDAGDLGCG
jgi:hypothetical protein